MKDINIVVVLVLLYPVIVWIVGRTIEKIFVERDKKRKEKIDYQKL